MSGIRQAAAHDALGRGAANFAALAGWKLAQEADVDRVVRVVMQFTLTKKPMPSCAM